MLEFQDTTLQMLDEIKKNSNLTKEMMEFFLTDSIDIPLIQLETSCLINKHLYDELQKVTEK